MKIQIHIFLCLLFGLLSSFVKAQKLDSIHYGLEYHYGFIMSHHENMKHLSDVHISAFELSFEEDCAGEKPWHQLYRFPRRGISIWYSSLGNNSYLGYSIAAIPYMKFSLIKSKKYNSFFQSGCGIAYLSNPYDRLDNPKNNTIGSRFNAAIRLMYDQNVKINNHWEIISGVGITHFSNGAFTLPNYGVNNMTIRLGVSYIPQQMIPKKTEEKNKKIRSTKWDVYSLIGVKENYPAAGPKYFSFDFCFDRVHVKTEKFDWYYGIDIMYDQAKRNALETDSVLLHSDVENTQIAAKFGGAWKMGNFSVHTQIGFYLYTKDKSNGRIYDRLMLRYRVGNHWMFNLAIKTHYAKADILEAGIGYRL